MAEQVIRRPTANGRTWMAALASSALAGLLACLSLIALLLALILIGGAWQSLSYARTGALGGQARSISEVLAAGLRASLANAWGYFWQARAGVLALAVLGVVSGAAERFAWQRAWPYRWSVSFGAALWLTTTALITAQLWQREQIAAWIVDHPGAFSIAANLLSSLTTLYAAGLGFSLILGYLAWETWRWWYVRLFPPCLAERVSEAPAAPRPTRTEDWRAYADRLRQLKRGEEAEAVETVPDAEAPATHRDRWLIATAIGIVVMAVSLGIATAAFQRVGPRITRLTAWAEPAAPHVILPMEVTAVTRRVNVSNVHGEGRARVWLSRPAQEEPIPDRPALILDLTDDPRRVTDVSLDLAGLPPGKYALHMALEDSQAAGGQLRIAILYRGQPTAPLAALWAGASLGGLACMVFLLIRTLWSSR